MLKILGIGFCLILIAKEFFMTDYTVIDNTELNRFEIHVDGHIALEDYKLFDGGIDYVRTKVPDELGGRGIASFLGKGSRPSNYKKSPNQAP